MQGEHLHALALGGEDALLVHGHATDPTKRSRGGATLTNSAEEVAFDGEDLEAVVGTVGDKELPGSGGEVDAARGGAELASARAVRRKCAHIPQVGMGCEDGYAMVAAVCAKKHRAARGVGADAVVQREADGRVQLPRPLAKRADGRDRLAIRERELV